MHLVASVRPSVCLSVRLFALSRLNRLTSALPSAAKSNKSHYQFKVFVCVSAISGRMRIIARMRLIGVLIQESAGPPLLKGVHVYHLVKSIKQFNFYSDRIL